MAPPDWQQYTPDPSPDDEPAPKVQAYAPPPEPTRPRTIDERTVRRRGGFPGFVGVGVIALTGGLTAGIVALSDGSDVAPAPAAEAEEKPDVHSVRGFADLVEAVREETGATTVFEAVLYPSYAVVDAPFKAGDVREVSYSWDGALRETNRGNTDDVPFDLAKLDSSRFAGMCAAAESLVEDAESCYLIIRRPEDPSRGWISAYASNEFDQSAYVAFRLNGTEVARSAG